jgi:hypothetical protein
LDPAAEDFDPVRRPRSVAGHRPGLHALEDGLGMRRYIVVRPQVEGEAHRCAVDLAKEGPYVLFEADRLVWAGKLD